MVTWSNDFLNKFSCGFIVRKSEQEKYQYYLRMPLQIPLGDNDKTDNIEYK